MKKQLLFTITLLILFQIVFSQENANSCFQKGQKFHYTDKDSAYFYYQKAISQSKKEKKLMFC